MRRRTSRPSRLSARGLRAASAARAARKLAIELLDSVGIPDAAGRLDDYPHQFSGGMRQRVLIAMALIGRPDLLIADEPTTALDVSVQAQMLRILYDLVRKHHLAVMLITHNLGVVAQLCSHVAVMYAGNIIESGRVDAVLSSPTPPLYAGAARRGAGRERQARRARGAGRKRAQSPRSAAGLPVRAALRPCDAALQRQRPADDRHRGRSAGGLRPVR